MENLFHGMTMIHDHLVSDNLIWDRNHHHFELEKKVDYYQNLEEKIQSHYNKNMSAVLENYIPKNTLDSTADSFSKKNIKDMKRSNGYVTSGNEETKLQRFYKGKIIFITGGTGFMGKILIEKLLRSCNGVDTIYMLVRQKKGKDVYSRIEEIFDNPVFERLRIEEPKFRHKIVAVPGDCSKAGLGLSLTDRQMLISKVDLVFHTAATVRFDEKLRTAMAINVHGTRDIMELCRSMSNLKALIHVSTAYSNSNLAYVEEKFYTFPIKLEELEVLLNKCDDEQLNVILPKILGDWPNTYTFTKALAENIIQDKSESLNVGIFRPAIVVSTASEPIQGWIDNFYGPTGFTHGIAAGVLRTLHCDSSVNGNMVPVDYCVNALLASAWDVANNDARSIPIYNYESSAENPITWKEFMDINFGNGMTHPLSGAMWYCSITMNKSTAKNKLYMVLLHIIPAIFLDGLALCAGKKPRLLELYRKFHKLSSVIAYFCTHHMRFSNSNVQTLWNKLEKDDQQIFNFSIKSLDWNEYLRNYIHGMRKYLLKEDDSTLETARMRFKRLYYLHKLVKMALIFLFIFICWMMIENVISRFLQY